MKIFNPNSLAATMLMFVISLTMAMGAQGARLEPVELSVGTTRLIGIAGINNDSSGIRVAGSLLRAIDESGVVIWDSAIEGSELNFILDNTIRTNTVASPISGTQFSNKEGVLSINFNPTDTFDPNSTFAVNKANIQSGDLALSAIQNGEGIGQFSDFNIGINTLFDVVGGVFASGLDTNLLLGGADISLNLSGDTFAPGAFTHSATSNVAVTASVVPLPATAWLLGSGLIGVIGFSRKKVKG